MKILSKLARQFKNFKSIPNRLDRIQESLGRIEARQLVHLDTGNPRDYEFQVYSQWGEDGIINYLINKIEITNRSFIEFGVENYTEANTLFLLKHMNWRGLVIDGSEENIESIRRGQVLWRYDLTACQQFITAENVDHIFRENGFSGEIGILSIDIDGNDYWVWSAIRSVNPQIVICEYNSLFGPDVAISTPYQPDFDRSKAHSSKLYYGASIAAFEYLAKMKGYTLGAGNSAGNNLFFVRNDCMDNLNAIDRKDAYVAAAFRETRNQNGAVILLDRAERRAAIADLFVTNVITGDQIRLGELT